MWDLGAWIWRFWTPVLRNWAHSRFHPIPHPPLWRPSFGQAGLQYWKWGLRSEVQTYRLGNLWGGFQARYVQFEVWRTELWLKSLASMALGYWYGYAGFIFMGLEGRIWDICLGSSGWELVEQIQEFWGPCYEVKRMDFSIFRFVVWGIGLWLRS